MDPNTNQILRDILEKTEDSNKLLHKMHRAAVWGRVFRFFYWIVIIGVAVGSYYYLSPYLETLIDAYNNIMASVGKIQTAGNSVPQIPAGFDIGAFLKGFQK